MNKKKLGIIIGVVLVVLLGGGVLVSAMLPKLMPEVYVAKAFANTTKTFTEEGKAKEEMFLMGLFEGEESLKHHYEMKLSSINGQNPADLLGPQADVAVDVEVLSNLKESLTKIDLKQQSKKIIGIEYFLGEEEVAVAVPPLFDDYLQLRKSEIKDKFNTSALSQMLELTLTESDIETLEMLYGDVQVQEELPVFEYDFLENVKVSYEGKGEVGDSKTKVYHLSMDGAAMSNLAEQYYDYIFNVVGMRDYLESSIKLENLGWYTEEEIKAEVDVAYQEGLDTIKAIDFQEGVVIAVNVNKKNQVVAVEATGKLVAEGDQLEYTFTGKHQGNKYLSDQMEYILALKTDYAEAKATLNITSNLGEKDKEKYQQVAFVMQEEGQEAAVDFKLEHKYNTESNEMKGQVVLGVEGESLGMDYEGKVSYDEKAKRLQGQLDKCKMYMDSYGEVSEMVVAIGYDIEVVEPTELKPSNLKNILDMTEDDWMSFGFDVMLKAQTLSEELAILGN